MVLIYLLLVLVAVIYFFISGIKKKRNYWKDRGVTQLNPHWFYGDAKETILQKRYIAESFTEYYYKFKKMGAKHGGIYTLTKPTWLPVDPSIIKLVLTTDHQYFSAHNPKYFDTLFFNNIFHMEGEEWKDMRRKLTPTFTSGKMKMMFDILLEKTTVLSNLVGDMIKSGEKIEFKELISRYTIDVIATCGFGIECDSIKDKNAEFFKQGQEMFYKMLPRTPPKLYQLVLALTGLFRYRKVDISDTEDFFRNIAKKTVQYREENKVVRRDFLHLLIQLKNRGTITDIINENDVYLKNEEEGMSMEDIAGQCLMFFSAGFETSSATVSFALLALSRHQEIQKKLREEVREILKKHNGVLTYYALQEMVYCDNVIQETLRKFPPLANIPRMCTKTYRIPDTDAVIEKGTIAYVPLLAIQNDPEYFPEPEKFDPDRFKPENKSKIVDFTYIPFGEGPRQCIGLRFAMMQSKAGIASLINRFNFSPDKRTPYPPKFSPKDPLLTVDGGIYLNVEKVN